MGTPLPEIKTLPGVECPICPESGGPFPDGPTPLNPVMIFTDFLVGDLWDESFRKELNAGVELLQTVSPCLFSGESSNFSWFVNFTGGLATISILRLGPPPEFAFAVAAGVPCLVEYSNEIVIPTGAVCFDGKINLTWGGIV